jgi:hypothetical protein
MKLVVVISAFYNCIFVAIIIKMKVMCILLLAFVYGNNLRSEIEGLSKPIFERI